MSAARRRGPWWLLPLVALVAGIAVERLVVTDEEQIERLLADAFRAVKDREPERLRPLLADDFEHEGRGPDEAVAEVRRQIQRHAPTLLELEHGAIVVARDRAEVEVRVRAFAYGAGWTARVRLTLAEGPDGWLVLSAVRTE